MMQDEMNDLQEVYTDPNPGDLIRVVRCRDCQFYSGPKFSGYGKCERQTVWQREDWYCGDGVRKDG